MAENKISKFLGFLKLSDSEYDDDYDDIDDVDDEEEEVKAPREKKSSIFRRSQKKEVEDVTYEDIDMDDTDDDIVTRPEPKKPPRKEKVQPVRSEAPAQRERSSSPFRRNSGSSKIVSMTGTRAQGSGSMEVCILKPLTFDNCREVSDTLLTGKAVVINFAAVPTSVAQRIIDFVAGTCYAIEGDIQQISDTIIIVTPKDITISGDIEDILTSGSSNVTVPAFDEREDLL